MKKLSLTLVMLIYCITQTYAQRKGNDFEHHEIGFDAGVGKYIVSSLFGASEDYGVVMLTGNYHYRPKRHFMIGLEGGIGKQTPGRYASSVDFNMSFPIGRNASYFYPGWHFSYASIDTEGELLGLGIHLGNCIAVSDMIAVNLEMRAGVLLFGSNVSFRGGVRVRL